MAPTDAKKRANEGLHTSTPLIVTSIPDLRVGRFPSDQCKIAGCSFEPLHHTVDSAAYGRLDGPGPCNEKARESRPRYGNNVAAIALG
jgi:hypothetical protein